MNQKQSITSLPESPHDNQQRRIAQYSIAMGVRIACVIACFFVQGWWLLVFVIGALVLPYIAVVLANVGGKDGDAVERPGSILPVPFRRAGSHDAPGTDDE